MRPQKRLKVRGRRVAGETLKSTFFSVFTNTPCKCVGEMEARRGAVLRNAAANSPSLFPPCSAGYLELRGGPGRACGGQGGAVERAAAGEASCGGVLRALRTWCRMSGR